MLVWVGDHTCALPDGKRHQEKGSLHCGPEVGAGGGGMLRQHGLPPYVQGPEEKMLMVVVSTWNPRVREASSIDRGLGVGAAGGELKLRIASTAPLFSHTLCGYELPSPHGGLLPASAPLHVPLSSVRAPGNFSQV